MRTKVALANPDGMARRLPSAVTSAAPGSWQHAMNETRAPPTCRALQGTM